MPLVNGVHAERIADLDLLDPYDCADAIRAVSRMEKQRETRIRSYRTNIDFLEGGVKQWYSWASNGSRGLDPNLPEDDLLITFNIILVQIETLLSRLMRPDPVWGAAPTGEDERDIMAARRQEDVLSDLYRRELRMQSVLARLFLNVFCSDITWLTLGWDHMSGNIVETSFDDFLAAGLEDRFGQGEAAQQVDPNARRESIAEIQREFETLFGEGSLQKGSVAQHEGKPFARVTPITEMLWYPFDPKVEEGIQIYIEDRDMLVEEAADRYGLTNEEVRGMRGGPNPMKPRRQASLWGRTTSRKEDNLDENIRDVVRHRELHRRPTLRYPQGVHAILLGSSEHCVTTEPITASKNHTIPHFRLVQHELPDSIFGTCSVSQLRSVNMDINKSASQESLFRDSATMPQLVVPQAGMVDQNVSPTNRPGEMWICTSRSEGPYFLDRPTLGIDGSRSIDRDISMMREISSVSGITAGKTDEANVRSGRAIEKLDNSLSERVSMLGKRVNVLLEMAGQHMVETLQVSPVGSRLSQITGEDNRLEWFDWEKDDLRPVSFDVPNRVGAQIKVTAWADIPLSRDANVNYVLQIVEKGLLRPGVDDAEIWKMLGAGDSKLFRDRDRADRARQNWEINLWRKGQLAPRPMEHQRHDIQISVMESWIRGGDEFDRVSRQWPWIRQEVMSHLREHRILQMTTVMKLSYLEKRARLRAWQESVQEVQADGDQLAIKLLPVLFPIERVIMDAAMPEGIGAQTALLSQDSQAARDLAQKVGSGGGRVGGQPGQENPNQPPQGNKPGAEGINWEQRDKARDAAS